MGVGEPIIVPDVLRTIALHATEVAGSLGLVVDVRRDYGASGSALQTTGTIAGGSDVLTIAEVGDFQDGQGIAVAGAGAGGALLVATIASGGGSTTLVLTEAAATSVAGAVVSHDDTAALETAANAVGASGMGVVPSGVYRISTLPSFSQDALWIFSPDSTLVLGGVPQHRFYYYHKKGRPFDLLEETFASGSSAIGSATINAGSSQVRIASPHDFRLGEGVVVAGAGPATTATPPTALSVTPTGGTTGSYTYDLCTWDGVGGVSVAASVSTTTGPSTLSDSAYQTLGWSVGAGHFGTLIYRSSAPAGIATGYIGIDGGTSFVDVGQPVLTPPFGIPSSPPSSSVPQWMVSQITDVDGGVLIVKNSAANSVSDAPISHEDSQALNALFSRVTGGECLAPSAVYPCFQQVVLAGNFSLRGSAAGPFSVASLFDPSTDPPMASTMLCYYTGSQVSFSNYGSTVENFLWYYPAQAKPSANTPLQYGPTLDNTAGGGGSKIRRSTMVNSFACINWTGANGGRTYFQNLLLGGMSQDLFLDHTEDLIVIDDVFCHVMWDIFYGVGEGSAIDTWVKNNRLCLITARTDGVQIGKLDMFLGSTGWTIADSNDTSLAMRAGYGQVNSLQIDTFKAGIICSSTNTPGWVVDNLLTSSIGPYNTVVMQTGGTHAPLLAINGGSWNGGGNGAYYPASGAGDLFIRNVAGFNNPQSESFPNTPTNPPAGGAVYQNQTTTTLTAYIPCYAATSGTEGTVSVALGASNPPPAIFSKRVSGGTSSATEDVVVLRIPAGWFYSYTLSGAVLSAGLFQAD